MVTQNNTTEVTLTTDRETAREISREYDDVEPTDSTLTQEWINYRYTNWAHEVHVPFDTVVSVMDESDVDKMDESWNTWSGGIDGYKICACEGLKEETLIYVNSHVENEELDKEMNTIMREIKMIERISG